jgi:hypothetical protein
MVKPKLLEERIFNSITWAPRIWGPWDNLFDCRIGTLNMTGDFPMGIRVGPKCVYNIESNF